MNNAVPTPYGQKSAPRRQVKIYLQDKPSKQSTAHGAAIVSAFATMLKIPYDTIKVNHIDKKGRVIILDIPAEAVDCLRATVRSSLVQDNRARLRLLKVEKVILETVTGELEEWKIHDRLFVSLSVRGAFQQAAIASEQKWAKILLLVALVGLMGISLAANTKTNPWVTLLVYTLGFIICWLAYNYLISWLIMPWPHWRTSSPGKHALLVILILQLALLGILIILSTLENLAPENRILFFPIGAIPVFIIHNWVFLAILLGATDHLPKGWEIFWDRPIETPGKFNRQDRRALGVSVGGLLLGNCIALFHLYQSQGGDVLGQMIVGALLLDFFAIGFFFWIFRRGYRLWGLLLLSVWAISKNFSFGVGLAQDLGVFFEWLLHRFLEFISF